MSSVPNAGRLFLSLWMVFAFFADPMPEISTVRHLYLARAVAERGGFEVEAFAHRSRGDLAAHDGHLYSGSPPALGLILSPLAAARHAAETLLPLSPNQSLQLMALWFFQAPLAALSLLLLARLLLDLGIRTSHAVGTVLVLGLGTPFFFFAVKLSDYPLGALLAVLAAQIGIAWRRGGGGESRRTTSTRGILAGLVLGLAWAHNDLAFLLTGLLLAGCAGTAPAATWAGRLAGIALGALPGAGARALYSAACFDSPWANPLTFSAAGISVTAEYARFAGTGDLLRAALGQLPLMFWDLSAGDVGLFVFAPCTFLVFGWRRALRATHPPSKDLLAAGRAGLLVFAVNAVLHIVLLNGLWRGGASWGPRYLLFGAVALAIPAAVAASAWPRRVVLGFAAWSVFINWVGVQYGYATRVLDALGLFLIGGPTTPAFRWAWLHWAWTPSPERIAWVWEETPRIGVYHAFSHPSPFLGYLLLVLALAATWRPFLARRFASITRSP